MAMLFGQVGLKGECLLTEMILIQKISKKVIKFRNNLYL